LAIDPFTLEEIPEQFIEASTMLPPNISPQDFAQGLGALLGPTGTPADAWQTAQNLADPLTLANALVRMGIEIPATSLAGLAGLAATPFVGAGEATDLINRIQEGGGALASTIAPKSEAGQLIQSALWPMGRVDILSQALQEAAPSHLAGLGMGETGQAIGGTVAGMLPYAAAIATPAKGPIKSVAKGLVPKAISKVRPVPIEYFTDVSPQLKPSMAQLLKQPLGEEGAIFLDKPYSTEAAVFLKSDLGTVYRQGVAAGLEQLGKDARALFEKTRITMGEDVPATARANPFRDYIKVSGQDAVALSKMSKDQLFEIGRLIGEHEGIHFLLKDPEAMAKAMKLYDNAPMSLKAKSLRDTLRKERVQEMIDYYGEDAAIEWIRGALAEEMYIAAAQAKSVLPKFLKGETVSAAPAVVDLLTTAAKDQSVLKWIESAQAPEMNLPKLQQVLKGPSEMSKRLAEARIKKVKAEQPGAVAELAYDPREIRASAFEEQRKVVSRSTGPGKATSRGTRPMYQAPLEETPKVKAEIEAAKKGRMKEAKLAKEPGEPTAYVSPEAKILGTTMELEIADIIKNIKDPKIREAARRAIEKRWIEKEGGVSPTTQAMQQGRRLTPDQAIKRWEVDYFKEKEPLKKQLIREEVEGFLGATGLQSLEPAEITQRIQALKSK